MDTDIVETTKNKDSVKRNIVLVLDEHNKMAIIGSKNIVLNITSQQYNPIRVHFAAEGDMQGLLRGLGTALLATNLFTGVLRLAWCCFSDTPYLLSATSSSFLSASCGISFSQIC